MHFIKRICIYILIFLLFLSFYHDFTTGYPSPFKDHKDIPVQMEKQKKDLNVVKVRAEHGDTVLSIMERLHPHDIEELDISQMIDDFKMLNSNVDPYTLQQNTYYLFPFY